MTWQSTKTYGHAEGLSTCFRQWRADSHCSKLHGYALEFSFTFQCFRLDDRGWVMDFGGLKPVKQWLKDTFDHKTVVAADDPELAGFRNMDKGGLIALVILNDGVGCERFAELAGVWVNAWLTSNFPHVRCVRAECREHGANSAVWLNP